MLSSLPNDLVVSVQGVRRCGKSTFLSQIMNSLKLNPACCYFVNFEDPRLSNFLGSELLQQIYKFAVSRHPPDQKVYFFLDEIQNVADWEKWLALRVARPSKAHFVVSGSNAALLSGDLGTVLTGRHITLEMTPFDFYEYKMLRPSGTLESYLSDGGFPRTLTFENPGQLLREYFADILEKDVRRHVSARSVVTLQQVAMAIFESVGAEVSLRKLAKLVGISADTIGVYVAAFESAYLVGGCPFFSYSERQRMARNRKFYPVDNGLRMVVVSKVGRDIGENFETIVYHKLRKHCRQVFYWREKFEVDFVIQSTEGLQPIQVSWTAIQERHLRGAEAFRMAHERSLPALFITQENAEEFLSRASF
jgi:uncharacterized protein